MLVVLQDSLHLNPSLLVNGKKFFWDGRVFEPSEEASAPAAVKKAKWIEPESRRIRVFTTLEASSVSGAIKPVLEFAREANRAGQDMVEVVAAVLVRGDSENSLIHTLRQEPVQLELIRDAGPWDYGVVTRLKAAIARWQPDILWTHNSKSHFLVRFFSLRQGAKWIATHHGYTDENLRARIYNQLGRWALPAADHVLTVCSAFAEDLKNHGVNPACIHVQHSPISCLFERPSRPLNRTALGIPSDAKVIITVGRLSPEKGHVYLIRAAAEWRRRNPRSPLFLIIVGEGLERQALISLCSDLQVNDMVRLVGFQRDVVPYYDIADIFVLPSLSEGSPNVLLEAAAAGIPIVATAVGGIPEMLENAVSALLIPAENSAAIVDAVRLVLGNEHLSARLVDGGRRLLLRHTPEKYFRNVLALFQKTARGDV